MTAVRTTKRRIAGAIAAATTLALAVGAGAALPAQAAPAPEGRVLHAGAAGAIPGSYIVTLKETAGFRASAAQGKQLIAGYGGRIERTYTSALNGYAAQLSSAGAKRLAADPAVASVEQNQKVHSTATQTNAPWGLDRIDQPNLPLNGTFTYPDSAGVDTTVYVLDTGVRITHQDIVGRASNGYDFADNDNVAQDGNGHGTHVATTAAGTVYGVAKKAKIVAVRVLNNSGSGTTAGVIAGVDWITANHVASSVANVSLGGGPSTTLDNAVRRSIASGVTYSIAAAIPTRPRPASRPPGWRPRSPSAPRPGPTPVPPTPTMAPSWTSSRRGPTSRPAGRPRTPPPTPATARPSPLRTSPGRPLST